jgi:hypothetical protein
MRRAGGPALKVGAAKKVGGAAVGAGPRRRAGAAVVKVGAMRKAGAMTKGGAVRRRRSKLPAVVAVAALAVLFWREFPAIKRYYNISRM